MDIELFDYDLDPSLIAQTPLKDRDKCRLLVVDKTNKTYKDEPHFYEILKYLKKGDVLVRNNTKVIPARIYGIKEETNAHIECLLLKNLGNDVYECLIGNAKVIKLGTKIKFSDKLYGECIEVKDEGIRIIKFIYEGIFLEILEEIGNMPLPPYIKEKIRDKNDYQTIYASKDGSSAAPTAGFHFSEELFAKIKEMGIDVIDVTLTIGLGTFRPVKEKDVLKHHMHEEEYEISEEAAAFLNKAKKDGRRIIGIGTTSLRTLEANISKYGEFKATKESTDIFIYPGYSFKAIDALITNFHLPKSTLIMLVSALMGREFTMEVYKHAVEERYRFFSFGDAMFIY